ncbi:MAG: 2-oxo-4-hydroxy-4-carboxy-5-ureidoimidazoline decarboxylase [Spirochaetia bacterium]|nr:2-oxo-4-hydroxy-4-carboxy-5-ureidoimidazoline decarboxylase [Spirochaetia bacterium]
MEKLKLSDFNALPEPRARELLSTLNTSSGWIHGACVARPFASIEEMKVKVESLWFALPEDQWLEAFEGHPKIGDVDSLKKKYAATKSTAENEQSGTSVADEAVLHELKADNDRYAAKFGFIFIVFATGKSAAEMLEILKKRLPNSREQELQNAAVEQNKITLLRIDKAIQE